jgi:hypothetical protein
VFIITKMKRLLLAFSLFFASPVFAGEITHKIVDSVQLTVDGAASAATRIGSSYAVTGSNISATTFGGLTAPVSASAAATQIQGSYDVNTAGQAFSFSESFTLGDAVPSGTTVTSGVVGSLPSFGSVTTSSGGVAGSLAGTLSSTGVPTVTAGGAGTQATGQRSVELSVFR